MSDPQKGAASAPTEQPARRRQAGDAPDVAVREAAAALAAVIRDARAKGYSVRMAFQVEHLEAIAVSAGAKALGDDARERKVS